MDRIDTTGIFWSSFGETFLVECPKCTERAEVRVMDSEQSYARLTCLSCGYSKERKHTGVKSILFSKNPTDDGFEPAMTVGPPVDWFFREPLWLQIPCGSNILWAYNERHLAWLKEFVSAGLRERRQDPETGWSNQGLAGRLPRWLISAKNRERVLKAIGKLEGRAGPSG